jgi:hypothetical protein
MNEIEVKNLRFKTSRGLSPAGKRYEYNTIMVFEVKNDELAMGVKPIEYIRLKRLLGEELDSLEKVMESTVKEIGKSKSFFAYFCNKFVQPKLEIIFSEIDKVIIDSLNVHYPPLGYDLLATVYLINKHEISNFGCGEAAVMAKIANKKSTKKKQLRKEKKIEMTSEKCMVKCSSKSSNKSKPHHD